MYWFIGIETKLMLNITNLKTLLDLKFKDSIILFCRLHSGHH